MNISIIDCCILVFLVINTIIMIYIGGFVVRMRDDQKEFFSDLVDLFGNMRLPEEAKKLPIKPMAATTKTWDQKYEEELDMLSRRSRQDSGLVDPDK